MFKFKLSQNLTENILLIHSFRCSVVANTSTGYYSVNDSQDSG